MVGTVDCPLAVFQKIYSRGLQGGADHQKKHSLLPGHVRKPGHHGGLQGVQSVIVDPVEDLLTSGTP